MNFDSSPMGDTSTPASTPIPASRPPDINMNGGEGVPVVAIMLGEVITSGANWLDWLWMLLSVRLGAFIGMSVGLFLVTVALLRFLQNRELEQSHRYHTSAISREQRRLKRLKGS